jgi:hypothetical protein
MCALRAVTAPSVRSGCADARSCGPAMVVWATPSMPQSLLTRVGQAGFGVVELGRQPNSARWAGICLKPFFYFQIQYNSIQISKIYRKIIPCPKIMKLVPLFF